MIDKYIFFSKILFHSSHKASRKISFFAARDKFSTKLSHLTKEKVNDVEFQLPHFFLLKFRIILRVFSQISQLVSPPPLLEKYFQKKKKKKRKESPRIPSIDERFRIFINVGQDFNGCTGYLTLGRCPNDAAGVLD